jgi:formate hydrogenlyase subunit 3/multisubunit Na+/H+ antiporter MnhD subunit
MTKLGGRIGTGVLVAALLGLLAASVWFAARTWISVDGPPLPTSAYVAMTLGVVFSIIVGCGLMALVFYSNRYGYDERSNQDQRAAHHDGRSTGETAPR